MSISAFGALRERLLTTCDFADAYAYYAEHIADSPADQGEPYTNADLHVLAARTAVSLLGGREPVAVEIQLYRIAAEGFIHGILHLGTSHRAIFVYFEDLPLGLVAVGGQAGPTHFGRLAPFRCQHVSHASPVALP
jgi:hypothetical protein